MAILVKVSHRYEASAERVFDAWLNVEKAGKFLFATTGGEMIKAELDPRVGGRFLFVDRRAEGDVEHFGEYLEIDRPSRIAFLFWVTGTEENRDRVTVDIKPLDAGCEVTLTHEMDEQYAEYRDRTQHGWTQILENLSKVV
jgi:uncharacterized protein YndB with AHSA1/START domain